MSFPQERTSRTRSRRRAPIACLAGLTLALLTGCWPPESLLPPLVSTTPADGETVSRSAWLVARFAGDVAAGGERHVFLLL